MDKTIGTNAAYGRSILPLWEAQLSYECGNGRITARQKDKLLHCYSMEEKRYQHYIINSANTLYNELVGSIGDTAKLSKIIGEVMELWNHHVSGEPLPKQPVEYLGESRGVVDRTLMLLGGSVMGSFWMSDVDMITEFIRTTEERKGFRYAGTIRIADIPRDGGDKL